MRLGIRGLLASGLFGLLAVAGAVAAMLVGHFLEDEAAIQVERQQRLRAVEIAERLAGRCTAADTTACDAALREAVAPPGDELEELTAIGSDLTLGGGTPLPCAARDPLVALAFQTRHVQGEVRGGTPESCGGDGADRHVVAVPALATGRVFRFGFDRAPLREAVAARRRTVLLALLADFAAVLLFGIYLVGRAVVRPLTTLTDLVDEVAARGLAEARDPRTVLAGGPREIERLQSAYGGMLAQLRARDAELREKVVQLEAARDDLVRSEKLATVGRLAAGIAHEVGNPLAALVGFVDYLRDDRGAPPDVQRELLGRMEKELGRIRDTIRQLLDFSRPQPPEPRRVDVGEVVRSAAELMRFPARMKTVTLTLDLAETPPVLLDPDRLRQVLVNLALNAGDALNGQGTITLRARADAGAVVLQVIDDGPGVPPEEAARIFDPFFSTKPAGEGTGLGLAICQRLVEEAGGTITLRTNENGRGACFEIRFPAAV